MQIDIDEEKANRPTVATWTQKDAIALCEQIETVCPPFGCHVALTGGTLYKEGERKDCDIVFYRIRQIRLIDIEGLLNALYPLGISYVSGFGWCYKLDYLGRNIDAFFPEEFAVKNPKNTKPAKSDYL